MRGARCVGLLIAVRIAHADAPTQVERPLWLPPHELELSLSAFLPGETSRSDQDPGEVGSQLDLLPAARLSLGPVELVAAIELTAFAGAQRDTVQAVAGGVAVRLGPGLAELRARDYSRFGRDAQDAVAVQATYALKQVVDPHLALVERAGLADDEPRRPNEPSDHWQWLLAGAAAVVQLGPTVALAASFDASLPVLSGIAYERRRAVFAAAIGPSVLVGRLELSALLDVRVHQFPPAYESTLLDYDEVDGTLGGRTSLAVLVTASYRHAALWP